MKNPVRIPFTSADGQDFVLFAARPLTEEEMKVFTGRTGDEVRALLRGSGFEALKPVEGNAWI